MGLCCGYVNSHPSIYRWDCCAVHPILLAAGGGIISYKHALRASRNSPESLKEEDLSSLQVSYIKATGAISNRRDSVSEDTESLPGIIAYRSAADALNIINILK